MLVYHTIAASKYILDRNEKIINLFQQNTRSQEKKNVSVMFQKKAILLRGFCVCFFLFGGGGDAGQNVENEE